MCIKEINAERQKVGAPALKYNSRLESTAKSGVAYMIKYDCYQSGCIKMGLPIVRAGWLTRRNLKFIAESKLALPEDGKLDCNEFVKKWLASRWDQHLLFHRGLTDVGCFANRCKKCQLSLYINCVYGGPK